MRLQASVGGLLFVVAVAIWHSLHVTTGEVGAPLSGLCSPADRSQFCAAVAGLSTALHDPVLQLGRRDTLPPAETPGIVDPTITQANVEMTICRPGYSQSARPSFASTDTFKRRLMDEQHPGERMADYELDHLIPISLGGAAFDRRNLWLQPRLGQANAADKNVLAFVLWRLVCTRRVPLRTAQQSISRDWTKAYATYATAENVATYHIRPAVRPN